MIMNPPIFLRLTFLLLLTGILISPTAVFASKTELLVGGGNGGDGAPAKDAKIEKPYGVDRDPAGNLLIVDYTGHLRMINTDGKLVTLCGSTIGDAGDGGPASAAKLNAPHSIAITKNGDIYIADTFNNKIRKIDGKTQTITTFAGTGTKSFTGDGGPADKATFNQTICISFNPDQSKLIVTDIGNHRIRAIDMTTHVITTIAGGGKGTARDGEPAISVSLTDPRTAAYDSKGNLYILERGSGAFEVVDPKGIIRTLIPGAAKNGDAHELAGPKHLAIDAQDNVLIADTDHHRIVKWDAVAKKIIPIAGTGKAGLSPVGSAAEQLQLSQPHGVFVEKDGSIIVSDSWNNRVVRVVE